MYKDNVETLCENARTALSEGRTDQAKDIYLEALVVRSDSPDAHYGLATVYFLLNDLTQSAYHFKEVTRLDPLRAGAYVNLGAVYNRLNQLDEAIPVLRRGIQLDMNRAEGYYNLGLVYRRKGQNDLAIQAYREATRVNPRMPDAHYNLGNLYFEKGQFGMALAHYRQALELRPDWEKARRGYEQAEAAQAGNEGPTETVADPAPVPATVVSNDARMERQIDPEFHGTILRTLHRATIDTDSQGRKLVEILEAELESAIKELSTCLLYPDKSATELSSCLKKFEAAVSNMRTAQTDLRNSLDRVGVLGRQILKM